MRITKCNYALKTACLCILIFAMVFPFALIRSLSESGVFAASASEAKQTGSVPTTVISGNLRIQLLSDYLVRIEEKAPKGFEDRQTLVVQNRTDWQEVDFSMTSSGGDVLIAAENYTVRIPNGATAADEVTIENKSGETLWSSNGKTTSNVFLPSPSDELKSWYFADNRIVPSENGFSPTMAYEPYNGWDLNNYANDYFVFLPGGDYKTFTREYVNLTGRSELVTLQMLGYWDSRWFPYSSETALQQIDDYLDKGYSIDVLVIDTDWRTAAGGTGYDINTSLFPNMAEFLQKCHEKGVSVVFNDHPEPVAGTSNALDQGEISFRNKNLKLILSLGLDYWWYDRNWHVALKSVRDDISLYAFGLYSYQWITEDYYNSISDMEDFARRALIMGNVDGCLHGSWKYASDLTAHRYSIQWTGDIGSYSQALEQEIYAAVYGGAEVGIPYMSSDIGGHTQAVSDDGYVRWLQYGALSTICRVHCTNENYINQKGRMPWLFGDKAEEVAHEYVDMRYRLLPLYYELAFENYQSGLPVMRRLDIEYKQYEEASANDEYMLGEHMLVAPVKETEVAVKPGKSMFTCDKNGVKIEGLKGEYFSNKDLSGSPINTVYGDMVDYDWGTGGPAGLGNDNYSVRWSGTFKADKVDIAFSLFADDGIRMVVDGKEVVNAMDVYDKMTTSPYFEKGVEHTIVIEYFEAGGNAHAYLYVKEREAKGGSRQYSTRDVFLPDGQWIDVWTGKRYVGPTTVTVTHGLETSPIFVREGAILPLANVADTTNESNWGQLSLELYPSAAFDTKQSIYEDDTRTVAYKKGAYRTTEIAMSKVDAENKTLKLDIGAAQGSFDGAKAFRSREWTVRVHIPQGWGEVVSVKANGKKLSTKYYVRSASAEVLANAGASRDADVVEFLVSGNVYEAISVEVTFASVEVTSSYNEKYDATEVKLSVATDKGNVIDTDAAEDWALFGIGGNERISASKNSLIGSLASANPLEVTSSLISATWNGGKENGMGAVRSIRDMDFTLKVTPGKKYYAIYLGGTKAIGKLTVRDRSGKNVSTVIVGSHVSASFTGRAVIEYEAETESEIYVKYSVLSSTPNGTGTSSNIFIGGVILEDKFPEEKILGGAKVTVSSAKYEYVNFGDANVNLTTYGGNVQDWLHTRYTYNNVARDTDRKAGAMMISDPSYEAARWFGDYNIGFTWSDGTYNKNVTTAKREGYCSPSRIEIIVKVDTNTRKLLIWSGAYHSSNLIRVTDMMDNELGRTAEYAAQNGAAVNTLSTFELSAEAESYVKIVITGSGDNVSLTAISLIGA